MAPEQAVLAVIPAAGASSRMGSPKALLDWEGIPLVAAHVGALERRCRVVVVVGSDADRVRTAARCATVLNPDWARSAMIDSVRRGVGAWTGPVLVQPVDTAPVEQDVLDALLAAPGSAFPLDSIGRPGHPIVLGPRQVAQLSRCNTLRDLLTQATSVQTRSPLVALGFNDPAALEDVRRIWRHHRAKPR